MGARGSVRERVGREQWSSSARAVSASRRREERCKADFSLWVHIDDTLGDARQSRGATEHLADVLKRYGFELLRVWECLSYVAEVPRRMPPRTVRDQDRPRLKPGEHAIDSAWPRFP